MRRVSCGSKNAILSVLSEGFAAAYGLDAEEVLDSLLERETLGSTGFGRGVAMPHARLDVVDAPVAMLVHLDRDVDFNSADGVPVRLVMGLISPTDAGAQHLHALAAMSRLTRDDRLLHLLFEAQSEEELFALIDGSGLRDAA
ncbi:PTS sugar transporter subunit IIA [Alteriqipengyuania lutimaris]|uniref:PTS sugar transporter subunit IIA n=1 Tax=Alteriqipengyuania lutimaris TaxID=1538146 RepID=UPI001852B976|nr:PTS sugar transporter subunit IIA [Alteriqipengyuania lutimaris]MBB3034448.1 PTS system nitrogen regulatory IIA component [Alteriqipengyuania lutimaris]